MARIRRATGGKLTRRHVVGATGAAVIGGALASGGVDAASKVDPSKVDLPPVEWRCTSATVHDWERFPRIVASFVHCEFPKSRFRAELVDGHVEQSLSGEFYLDFLEFEVGEGLVAQLWSPLDRVLCCRLMDLVHRHLNRTKQLARETEHDLSELEDAAGAAFDDLLLDFCDPESVAESREKCEAAVTKARADYTEAILKADADCEHESEKADEEIAKAAKKGTSEARQKAAEAIDHAEEKCLEAAQKAAEDCLKATNEAEEKCLEEFHKAELHCVKEGGADKRKHRRKKSPVKKRTLPP